MLFISLYAVNVMIEKCRRNADDEFLSSSTVIVEDQEFTGLEANKCYINDSENNKNYKLIEEIEVPTKETYSEEYSVAPGHLYKGKRYDIGNIESYENVCKIYNK